MVVQGVKDFLYVSSCSLPSNDWVPVKDIITTLQAIVYFQPCGNSLGKSLFLYQDDWTLVDEAYYIKTWFDELAVEELEGFAQSLGLNL